MNFFKSVFSDDPDPSGSESDTESDNVPQNKSQDTPDADSSPSEHRSDPSGAGAWNFGGLLKTLSTKSESIIETYRRDLQEFGTGLKKEIEVAHGSLETVGHAIDQFGNTVVKGTAQIISHGKDAILELDSSNKKPPVAESSLNSIPYSRFDAQVRAIQGDVSTYSEVPEDFDEYNKWKSEFSLEGKSDEMEGFLKENEAMKSVYERLVPNTVDRETFWFRYYYKVYKFKKAEDVRARLVRRMSWEEEDLSWDVEDDDDDNGDEREGQGKINLGREGDSKTQDGRFEANREVGIKSLNEEEGSKVEKRDDSLQSEELGNKRSEHAEESKIETKSEVVQEMGDGSKETVQEDGNRNGSEADSDKKVIVESKDDIGNGKSQVVAGSHDEEEDLEWDEIEDLSSIDEKKVAESGSPSKKVDLKKRLNAAEEDDLSWDIEDDDEPARA